MNKIKKNPEYLIAFFDILGFESRLSVLGLNGMFEKYLKLIEIINENNRKQELLKSVNMEGSFWAQDGSFELYQIKGAYASDSIILWAKMEMGGIGVRFADGSFGHPKVEPYNFLNLCNELICFSLEIGLPLRGAISAGEAIIDEDKRIFLGNPFVEVAKLEKRQNGIGATPCKTFQILHQGLNPTYFLPFENYLKTTEDKDLTFGAILDWPRHWRNSRKSEPDEVIVKLNTDERFSIYYENTLKLVEFSKANDRYWESVTK